MKKMLAITGALLLPALAAGAQSGPVELKADEIVVQKRAAPARSKPVEFRADKIMVQQRPGGPTQVELRDNVTIKSKGPVVYEFDAAGRPGWQFVNPFITAGRDDVRVDVSIEDATIRDALRQVFEPSGTAYTVEVDVPEDVRVSVKAKNVRLHSALDLITEAAGVQWTVEATPADPVIQPRGKDPKDGGLLKRDLVYRFGKKVQRWPALLSNFRGNPSMVPYLELNREERSTFVCPHCNAQSTMMRVRQQPKCTKCSRLFQSDWQFCPADGSKRPAAQGEWRFCPQCGKQVQPGKEQSDAELKEGELPVLSRLPHIGPLFRKAPSMKSK